LLPPRMPFHLRRRIRGALERSALVAAPRLIVGAGAGRLSAGRRRIADTRTAGRALVGAASCHAAGHTALHPGPWRACLLVALGEGEQEGANRPSHEGKLGIAGSDAPARRAAA